MNAVCSPEFPSLFNNPICKLHRVPLALCKFEQEPDNPPGPGHVNEWMCPVSDQRFLLADGF